MASITERNGRFFVRVRRQGFPTVSKTFTRRTDAQAWARRVEVDMEAGRWLPRAVPEPTFREVVEEYRRVVAPRMKGATTYRYRFEEFQRAPFAGLPLKQVSAADIAGWRDQQLQTLRPGTVTRKLAMLSSIFSWAIKERGWLTQSPLALISRPRAADSRSRVLSKEEVRWLMAAAATSKARWLPAALTILMRSAMRRGELFSLRREDIDFKAGVAHLQDTKSGSPRDVPLCPDASAALRELDQAAALRRDSLLLPLGAAGSLTTRFTVTVGRARVLYLNDCAQHGHPPSGGFLDDVRLHDLRHHAVTALASTGSFTMLELMAISGHKTPRMLARYTHLDAASLAEKLAKLPCR